MENTLCLRLNPDRASRAVERSAYDPTVQENRSRAGNGCFSVARNWEQLAEQAGYSPHTLARLCGTSLRHLQRHFKNAYGVKVRNWLNELRLKIAYQKLQQVDSVKAVAHGLGYGQVSNFCRDFKKLHGISPGLILGAGLAVGDPQPSSPAAPGLQGASFGGERRAA